MQWLEGAHVPHFNLVVAPAQAGVMCDLEDMQCFVLLKKGFRCKQAEAQRQEQALTSRAEGTGVQTALNNQKKDNK